MSGKRPYTAFTLIELLAVTVLLVGAVGWATLSFHGLGERGRIEAAGEQIASAYKLATLNARGSGLPAVLRCDANLCIVRVPRFVNDEWQWVDKARFAWSDGIELQEVKGPGAEESSRTESPWDVAVPAHGAWWTRTFRLGTRSGSRMDMEIDAFNGEGVLRFFDAEGR